MHATEERKMCGVQGGGGGNKVMLVGTLVHELLQSILHNQEQMFPRVLSCENGSGSEYY